MRYVVLVVLLVAALPAAALGYCYKSRSCADVGCDVRIYNSNRNWCWPDTPTGNYTAYLGRGCDILVEEGAYGSNGCRQVGHLSRDSMNRCVISSEAVLESPGCCSVPCRIGSDCRPE